MRITFLGTGAADALQYYNTCFFIYDKAEKGLLVDTGGGNGILSQLAQASIPLVNIDRVFLTHSHIDHMLGIFWIMRFLGPKIIAGTASPLTVYAPKKTKMIIEQFASILLKEKVAKLFGDRIVFHELRDGEQLHFEQGTLTAFDAHGEKDEMFGFRYDFKNGSSLVMIGDEPYKKSLERYCKDSSLFIHEAYCREEDRTHFKPETIGHSTVKEAAQYAQLLGVKKLVLTHSEERKTFGSRKELYTREGQGYFKGKILVPNDLESIDL